MVCHGMKPLSKDYAYVALGNLPNCRVDTHGGGHGGILPGNDPHRVSFDASDIFPCADCGDALVMLPVHVVGVPEQAAVKGKVLGDLQDRVNTYLGTLPAATWRLTLDQLYSGIQERIAELYTALGAHQMGRYPPDYEQVERVRDAHIAVAGWTQLLYAKIQQMADAAEDAAYHSQQAKGW